MSNKNLWFPRLEDIGCNFDFSPKKNRDALSVMYNKKKLVEISNQKLNPRKQCQYKYGDKPKYLKENQF